MNMKRFIIALSIPLLSTYCLALDAPNSSRSDNRIQYTNYASDDVVLIRAQVGRAVQIVLSPEEKVLEMVSGNSEAWEIVDRRNNIYLKPKLDNANTNLLITTTQRTYSFDLRVVSRNQPPTYRLDFHYPGSEAAAKRAENERQLTHELLMRIPSIYAEGINANYTMEQGKNSDSFKPEAMFDDGTFTYIKIANGKDMPSVFNQLENGEEAIVNSTVQGNFIIVQGVYKTLMLRANNAVIGLYNEHYTDSGKSTGTGTASPMIERVIK